MNTLVIGDVHACADELCELLDRVGPERVVLVGDLFTRGPHPERTWAALRDGGLEAVLGNHDQRLLDIVDGERAGDEHGQAVVERLGRADPGWCAWVRGLPLFLDLDLPGGPGPMVVVHAGLHPEGRARTTRRMATRMRRWPEETPEHPFWWQCYTDGPGVLFGHDAVRGHIRVDRGEQPPLLGLDTGCVYGGALSGWVVERDALISVPARRAYVDWRG